MKIYKIPSTTPAWCRLYRRDILCWADTERTSAPRRRPLGGGCTPRVLSGLVAAQLVAGLVAVALVRPGGPLPARAASAAPLELAPVSAVFVDPAVVEPSPVRPVSTQAATPVADLGPAAEVVADDTRPRRYKGRPVHYERWSFWGPRIRGCESGGGPEHAGSYTARNPVSSASGAYQVTDGSWGGAFGVRRAYLAAPADQERQAYALFLRRGTQPWAASQSCWET